MTTYVIIPATRWSQMLDRAIHSVGPEARIVVVLNGQDAAPRRAPDRRPVEIVRLDQPRGFAVACNAGFARAREIGARPGDAVLFLNDDAVLPSDWQQAVRRLGTKEIGAVSFRVREPAGPRRTYAGQERASETGNFLVHERPTLAGCAFAVRAGTLAQLGGFDESYGMYGEETDLFARLQKQGLLLVEDERTVWHEGESTMSTRPLRRSWHGMRNPLRYSVVNEPPHRAFRSMAALAAHVASPSYSESTDPYVLRRRALPLPLRAPLAFAAVLSVVLELPRLVLKRSRRK